MKFCTKCGAQNEDHALICVQCQSNLYNPNMYPKRNYKKIISILINIIGIFNGITSIILGIITFNKPLLSLNKSTELLLEEAMGISGSKLFIELITASTTFSFGVGSMLLVVGILIILHFSEKLSQKLK